MLKGECGKAFPRARCAHGATIIDQTMYIFGGRDDKDAMNDTWKFDLPSLTWQKIIIKGADRPTKRFGLQMLAVNETLLILGGIRDIV